MTGENIRPGHYLDHHGHWQKDRRLIADRRKMRAANAGSGKEQRGNSRRQADRELREADHREMIEEALEEFADDQDY